MNVDGLFAGLSEPQAAQVEYCVGVLEQIPGGIDAALLPAVAHPDLRPVIDQVLDAAGRVLVEHRNQAGGVVAYASGWADDIADILAEEGLGVLDPLERAVVALVLLRCVAEPTAAGKPPARWSQARGVPLERLHDTRQLPKGLVGTTVNRLHDRNVLVNSRRAGVRPGPAFDRLTQAQRQRIEQDLFLLAAPEDPIAVAIRRRRAAADADQQVQQAEGGIAPDGTPAAVGQEEQTW
jgi:hypothetical protein